MARGAAHLLIPAAEAHLIAGAQGQAHLLGAGGGRQADGAARSPVHQPAAGHVVGMDVGIEAGHQANVQLLNQREIPLVLLEHRVDQHALAAGPICQQVGEAAGGGVEQLAQQQVAAASGGPQQGKPGERSGHH